MLDWVQLSNLRRQIGEMDHHGGGVCVVCCAVDSNYSYVDKSMRQEFFVPAGTPIAVNLLTSIKYEIKHPIFPLLDKFCNALRTKMKWGFLTPWWSSVQFWSENPCDVYKIWGPFGPHCCHFPTLPPLLLPQFDCCVCVFLFAPTASMWAIIATIERQHHHQTFSPTTTIKTSETALCPLLLILVFF
jgi:hypothetical protein